MSSPSSRPQKGAIEIEIFESGEISELVVPVGAKVPVGTLLARIGGQGSAPTPIPTAAGTAAPGAVPTVTPAPHPTAPRDSGCTFRRGASACYAGSPPPRRRTRHFARRSQRYRVRRRGCVV